MNSQNSSNQTSTHSPYFGVNLNSDTAYHKQTEYKDQGILLHENLLNVGHDDEAIAINASPKKRMYLYLFSICFTLLVNIVGLVHFSAEVHQLSEFSKATRIHKVVSACLTLLMLVTIIYGLIAHFGKKQGRQEFFVLVLKASIVVFLLDIPQLIIFGDSTSKNIRTVEILASLDVLYLAKRL